MRSFDRTLWLIGSGFVLFLVLASLSLWWYVEYQNAHWDLESSQWESQMLRAQEGEVRQIGRNPSRSSR
jgi:hypothetical protein